MEFTINGDFANQYNEYRRKEEYQKLKSRYGDVKLTKSGENAAGEGDDASCTSSSSSSSEATESDSEEHEDFLRFYDALCREDPSLQNPSVTWFRQKPEVSLPPPPPTAADGSNKTRERKPILLKDHAREFLLSHGGMEDEESVAASKLLSKVDALKQLEKKEFREQKMSFLSETEGLFSGESADTSEIVFAKGAPKSEVPTRKKAPWMDTLKLTFGLPGKDEDFLRDYLVNRRWKSNTTSNPPRRVTSRVSGAVSEVPAGSNGGGGRGENDAPFLIIKSLPASIPNEGNEEPLLTTKDELDADDDFLFNAKRFEDSWNHNDSQLEKEYPKTSGTRYRFEEDTNEFTKSYPRHIEGGLRQPSVITRAEKRKARAERKAAEKSRKLADIELLRHLKMTEFAKKLQRLRKARGEAAEILDSRRRSGRGEDDGDVPPSDTINTDEIVDFLDDDWDPEAHDRLTRQLFGDDYYGARTADDDLEEPPDLGSDEEEADLGNYDYNLPGQSDGVVEDTSIGSTERGETSAISASNDSTDLDGRMHRKRAQHRSRFQLILEKKKPIFDAAQHADFEKYFDEFYQLDCEDIISGSKQSDDVLCRFKYRNVKPNDFGLSVEEILNADEKELNRWVPVKTMCAYKTEEEEERDYYKFHSSKMLRKKNALLPSLYARDGDEEEEFNSVAREEDTNLVKRNEQKLSKKASKRIRKKERKTALSQALSFSSSSATVPNPATSCHPAEVDSQSKKRQKRAPEQQQAKEEAVAEVKMVRPEREAGNGAHGKRHNEKELHRRSKRPKLSCDRLLAAGVEAHQFRQHMKRQERGS